MQFRNYVEFAWYRALAEVRADVSRGFLGLAWWLAEPILYMGVFFLVFGIVFQQRGENYVSFLLCGLVIWKWFDSSVKNSATSIQHNMGLIYQVYLPKVVFPVIAILTSTARFAFVFVVFLLFLLAIGTPVTAAWFTDLPLLLLLQFALMLGLGMMLSAVVPFVPDVKFLLDNGMMLLFFLSGIFFRFDAVPERIRAYFDLNPVAVLIRSYREVLISGERLDWGALWTVVVIAVCFLVVGGVQLWKWDRLYAKKAFV